MSKESWQSILQRGQQTVAVWSQFAPAFTVGALTLAAHQADLALLEPRAQALVTAEDAVDSARNARDASCNFIKDLAIRAPRKMDGTLAGDDPFHADLKHIRAVEMTGLDTILTRGQRTLSLWEKLNARNAAQVPAQPALTLGGTTAAQLATALAGLPALTQAVEDRSSEVSDARSDLGEVKARVAANNVRWYAAWEGEFAAGSAERNALSQIDTGTLTPQPTALEIASVAPVDATTVQVNYAAEGGDHATTMLLFYYVDGTQTWGNSVAVERPSQQITDPSFEQALVRFRTTMANSSGESDSAVKELQM